MVSGVWCRFRICLLFNFFFFCNFLCNNVSPLLSLSVPPAGSLDWVHICRSASKVVTFIDLAGHEKYLKTTIFGMTGHSPDFCMLMVGSNAGVIGMTKGIV